MIHKEEYRVKTACSRTQQGDVIVVRLYRVHIPEQWDTSSCMWVFTVFLVVLHIECWLCSEFINILSEACSWSSGVDVISCLWLHFCERKWACFCSLCVLFLNSSCLFSLYFPLTSSVPPSVRHCYAHPPFSPILSNCSTHNPTFQHILYHPPPPLPPLLFSFLVPHAKVYHSPGCPSSQHGDKQCVGQRAETLLHSGTCCVQCVLKRFTC